MCGTSKKGGNGNMVNLQETAFRHNRTSPYSKTYLKKKDSSEKCNYCKDFTPKADTGNEIPKKNENATCSSEQTKKYLFSENVKDTYVSSVEYGTGLRFDLYYEENSPEDNPVIIAKGIDEHGERFERRFAVKEIDPLNATSVEMWGWAYYQSNTGNDLEPLKFIDSDQLNDRTDYIAQLKEYININAEIGMHNNVIYYQRCLDFLTQWMKNDMISTTEKDIENIISNQRMHLGMLLNGKNNVEGSSF